MKLSSLKIKHFFIFSQKQSFLYLGKYNFFKKASYISGGFILSPENKKTCSEKFLILWKMKLLSPTLKNSNIFSKKILIFQEGI